MYMSRYLVYLSWIILMVSLIYNFKHMNKPIKTAFIDKKCEVINIMWNDSSKELYSIFKLAGITPDESQKKIIEKEIKNKYNQGTMGFKYNN